jgi:hypothetical protein
MKIIKSLLLLAVCFCTATIVYAQEPKAEIAKPIEVKIPAVASNKPSPQPELKPQPQVAAIATDAPAAAAAPSPLTLKEDAKPEEKEKQELKTFDPKDIATPGGEEGRKIIAGNASAPKDPIFSPSTVDPKPAPQVKPVKPANGRQQ